MLPTDTPSKISASRILHLAAQYATHIPAALQQLEAHRQQTLPSALSKPAQAKPPKPGLSKPDLVSLTGWKLKRGKFRPKLLSLVSSNTPQQVQQTTARAFDAYTRTNNASDDDNDTQSDGVAMRHTRARQALAILTELKGVGPATASLVLSVFDAVHVPFFSDELFAWVMTAPRAAGAQPSEDVPVWKGKIGYSAKEFGLLLERVEEVRGRVGDDVRAFDVELAAWVIVKGLADAEGDAAGDSAEVEDTPEKEKTKGKRRAGEDKGQGTTKKRKKY